MTRSERMAVRVTPELKKALGKASKEEERSISQIIERSVRDYLRKRERPGEDTYVVNAQGDDE